MLKRYIDVTRSQLFFSNGCLLVEGISEALMMNKFSEMCQKRLSDYQIEIVNLEGTAFTQFLLLFNSSDISKRLPMKLAVLTDEDQFTDSKKSEWDLEHLVKDNYSRLSILREKIQKEEPVSRIENLRNVSNKQPHIMICSGKKTFEYQLCRANVFSNKKAILSTTIFEYLKNLSCEKITEVEKYMNSVDSDNLSENEQIETALLLWKCMPGKAEFAQGFIEYLEDVQKEKGEVNFTIPQYIRNAIDFLIK